MLTCRLTLVELFPVLVYITIWEVLYSFRSFWRSWENSAVSLSGTMLFLARRLCIIASISWFLINLFKLFMSIRFNFDGLHASKNKLTYSRVYTDKNIGFHRAVAHAFNPSTWEAVAGRFLNLRPAWSTKWVPGQPGLYRETLSRKTNQTNKQRI